MKRLAYTASLMLFLAATAAAQTITVAPDPRYSSAIVPGAICVATLEGGGVFTFTTVFRGNPFFRLFAMPANTEMPSSTIQIFANKWMFKVNLASVDGVTGFRFVWPGHDVTATPTGVLAPVDAKPTITPTGTYASFQNPAPQPIVNGTLVFGPGVGLITVSFDGSDFGNITEWVLEILDSAQPTVAIQMPATAALKAQSTQYGLITQIPRAFANGTTLFIQARAADHPITSNVITMTVQTTP